MLLNTHTYYSFKYGTIATKELLQLAYEKGFKKVALTDINTTAACLDFVRLAPKHNVQPILGVDFRDGVQQQFVALAQNNDGFKTINDYLSEYLHEEKSIPPKAPLLQDTFIIYPFNESHFFALREHEFIGITPGKLTKLPFSTWRNHLEKFVILSTVSFRNKKADFNTHRLLRAIDNNALLSKLPKSEEGSPNDIMHSQEELVNIFKDYPQIIENTQWLLDNCEIHFEFGDEHPHKNIKIFRESKEEDEQLMDELCQKGLRYRYPNPDEKILSRLTKELEIIKQKGFLAYFLVNWEILNYARKTRLLLCWARERCQ